MEGSPPEPTAALNMEIKDEPIDQAMDTEDKSGLIVEDEIDADVAQITPETDLDKTENKIPKEDVVPSTTADTAYVLPDISYSALEFDDFHSKETVDDSSSVTTGFSATMMDQQNGLGYPQAGYLIRPQQRQVRFKGHPQEHFHPQYQAIDQVFPPPNQNYAQGPYYYREQPRLVHQPMGYNQDPGYYQREYQHLQMQSPYNQDYSQLPLKTNQNYLPSPLSVDNVYDQSQIPLNPTSPPGFQPRQDSRVKQFDARVQNQQHPPTPRTSLQRQKQIEMNDVGVPSMTRYCCGMFRTRKQCRIICIPITAVILIIMGLTIFFCYPRAPEISLNSLLYQTGDVALSGDFKRSSTKLSLPLFGNFSAASPNFIPYSAHIYISGSLVNPNDKSPARVSGHLSTSLKSDKAVYTSPGSNSFQMLLTYTYTQTSVSYSKNALRQVKFKEEDGDLQTLFLSCAPELIGVLPYPDRKPRMVTIKLDWKVDVLLSSRSGSIEKDVDCSEGMMRLLKGIAGELP